MKAEAALFQLGGFSLKPTLDRLNVLQTFVHKLGGIAKVYADGGISFTPKLAKALALEIKGEMENPSSFVTSEWHEEEYSDFYQEFKESHTKYSSPWMREGQLHDAVGFVERKTMGRSIVGVSKRSKAMRINLSGHALAKTYSLDEIAYRMETGYSGNTPGMPARPLFEPTTRYFIERELPEILDKYNKGLNKNLAALKSFPVKDASTAAKSSQQYWEDFLYNEFEPSHEDALNDAVSFDDNDYVDEDIY
jgi:hypothetical protein